MNKNTIRLMALSILLTGMNGMAFGANKKISEEDACGMAKAEILNRRGGENKRELTVIKCEKFSVLDVGMANIQVVYDTSYYNEYMKARYETKNLADMCNFTKTSEGWKLTRCR